MALGIMAAPFVAFVGFPHHLAHFPVTMVMAMMVATFVMITSGPVPKL
jgi:hypothetical protein